jgi:heme a synthase
LVKHNFLSRQFLSRLAFFASLFAFGVIALGAFTRLIDAGLGCPDWPGCYGHLVPIGASPYHLSEMQTEVSPFVAYKAWAEMIHRYFVAGLSIFILSIVAIIFASPQCRKRSNVILALALILLLAYQIMLGQWTVTLKLLPLVVTQHLLGGFFILVVLWLIYLSNAEINPLEFSYGVLQRKTKNRLLFFAVIGLVLMMLQITLGAWTSTNYASLSCPHFPFCHFHEATHYNFRSAFNIFSPTGINYDGGVLPEAARQTIQMTHRFGALLLTCYLFIFLVVAVRKLKKLPELMAAIYLSLGLLCIQLCIGISNVVFQLPLGTALSHTLFAILLLLSFITFTYKLAVYPCGDMQV